MIADCKMKTYVVFIGKKPGVYNSWAECHSQVSGFPGNLHQSYESREEAEDAYAKFMAKQCAKKSGTMKEIDASRHDNRFSVKDVILYTLVVVVVIQAYFLCTN